MTWGTAASENLQVSIVSLICVMVIVLTTQILKLDTATPALGLIVLYLGYHVSACWTPVPEWKPALFWSLSIILTMFIEILFAYLY